MGKWGLYVLGCAAGVFATLLVRDARAEDPAPAPSPSVADVPVPQPVPVPSPSPIPKVSKKSKAKKGEKTAALPSALVTPPAPVLSEEERDFARAQELLVAGKESEALISYSDFLRRYPTSAMADDAQFGIGEVYFRQRKYEEAVFEYRKVFRYGINRSDRIPEAAFQMGESWFRLKRLSEARIEWEALRRKFPNSESASKALSSLAGVP